LNPCFLPLCPATSMDALPEPFQRRIRFSAQAWTYADVISIVIRWQAFGDIRNRSSGPIVSVIRTVGSSSHCAFHSLRRTGATLLHEAGVPSAVAQALIGHESEALDELYISVGRETTAALPEI
jgi:hypothetical protein